VVQTTEVFEVERVLDAAGMVERRLVPAEDLVAGDELRYLIRLRNTGPARIEAGRIQVRTPVPEGVRFLPGSAGGAGTLVEYAVDGMTFSAHVPDQSAEPHETAAPTDGGSSAAALSASAPIPAPSETRPAAAPDSGQLAVQPASAEPQAAAGAAEPGLPAAGSTEAGSTGAEAAEAAGAEADAAETDAAEGEMNEGVAAATAPVVSGGPEAAAPEAGTAAIGASPDGAPAATAGTGLPAPALTIRWTYQQPLDPGAEAEVFFHVRLL
jgi:uncharacterized repeat protein (TIGR01451 family)